MTQYNKCSECGEEVTDDSEFCPHCGALFAIAVGVLCDTHQSVKATGVCIICRKLVCLQCSKSIHGKVFCLDHQRVEVQQDWATVFVSTEINEAELMKAILEKAQFRVLVQNFGSVGYAWDGGGDSPQSRSNLGRPAKLFVPIPEYVNASKTIEEWSLSKVDERASDDN